MRLPFSSHAAFSIFQRGLSERQTTFGESWVAAKRRNQEGVVAESVAMYDGNDEEAPAFDPSTSTQHFVFDTLRSEGDGLVELEQPGPPATEVLNEEDAAPDADNMSVPALAGLRFSLPCDNDGALAETMRRGGQSKAALLGSGVEML